MTQRDKSALVNSQSFIYSELDIKKSLFVVKSVVLWK